MAVHGLIITDWLLLQGLLSDAFFVAYAAPDNSVYFGNWGRGLVKVKNDSIKTYYINNTGIAGDPKDSKELVVSVLVLTQKVIYGQ